jgi:hypothetical protein
MSMATANGFAGTYSGTALTVSTTITGLLKGNGTAISAATAGTDYVIPSGSITGTAGNITATTNSTLTTLSALSLPGSQVTGPITGASGAAPVVTQTVVAGQSFTANTTYAVRWGMNSNSETTDRVYAADYTTSSHDFFWVVGVISGGAGVTAGQNVVMTSLGTYTLGSADTGFLTADAGQPVWLTTSGAFSTTAPSTAGQAATKIGMVQSTGSGTASQMWVMPQVMGVN